MDKETGVVIVGMLALLGKGRATPRPYGVGCYACGAYVWALPLSVVM